MIWRNSILRKIFLKLSISYIFNSKKDKAFSTSTILSSFALILGISILITVMSVMNGFREEKSYMIVGRAAELVVGTRCDAELLCMFEKPFDQLVKLVEKFGNKKVVSVYATAPDA